MLACAVGLTACERAEPDDPLKAAFRTADSLLAERAYTEAQQLYATLRDSLRDAGNEEGEWYGELWSANSLASLGRFDSAHAGLDRAMELAGDDPHRLAWTHHIRSWPYWVAGDLDASLAEARAARAAIEGVDDPHLAELIHFQFARIFSHRGRHRDALREHEAILASAEGRGAPPGQIARALSDMAIDYRHLGRYEDARSALERSARIHEERGNEFDYAIARGNLANNYYDLGEYEAAIEVMTEAMELVRPSGLPRIMSGGFAILAGFYRAVGHADMVRAQLDSATVWAERGAGAYAQLEALLRLGELELDEGNLSASAGALVPALTLADSAGFATERALARVSLARVRVRQNRVRDGLALARRAVALADSLGDPNVQVMAQESLGEALEAAGQANAALDRYLETMELLESWRGRLAVGDLRPGITEERTRAFDGAVRLLIARDRPGAALDVSERAKARRLMELMAQGRSDPDSDVGQLRQRLQSTYDALGAAEGAAYDSIVGEIENLMDDLRRMEAAARAADPVAGAARYPAPANHADIARELVGENGTLLAFHWGADDVFGWRVEEGGEVRAARLGHPDTLSALIEFARQAMFDPQAGADWRPVARRAYRTLIEPLRAPEAGRWLIVPDGPLAFLPFEALLPADGGDPVGASTTITYGPSASVLLTLAATPPRSRWERTLLAVGDPAASEDVRTAATRAGGLESLGSLPFAAREARELEELFAEAGADALIGDDATLENWRAQRPGRYRFLHFAAHAVVSDRRPGRTHIVLADGGLDLSAIRSLPLAAELVALSACETGLGRRVSGEGIIGLPHAFLAAGARGAIVSLWKVPDRAAYEYMRDLYARLAAGEAPAAAMQAVREERIRRGGESAHPSNWAGFVLVGSGWREAIDPGRLSAPRAPGRP